MNRYKLHKNLIINYLSFFIIGFCLLCGSQKIYAFTGYKATSVIEIEYPANVKGEQDKLLDFCKQQLIDNNDIYQWNNHFVIYGNGYGHLLLKVKSAFKECIIKFYEKPFYNFERSRCDNKNISSRLDNILLTADLVADPKLQHEYLAYHATQFEKWPEVSNGFCNASFQRLLVFRNGRQLMLVISIPKGDSLDKLNPLTTKNNPRVDEWNKIMSKYQQGVSGTKKGETWVFLKAYNQTNHINHQ
ncbi:MAG: L-rhamnose mutarotase [Mucilaginibacter sp.]|uniref:L-rhamnose mutarotase n=1 Tax=Mucilaginibacter sp. TaxID=1882438 RepID=UPI003263CF68